MFKGGYIALDLSDLVLDGVENTLSGISKKIETAYDIKKPIIVTDLLLKKELTGLTKDVVVPVAHCNLAIANNVYVLTCMVASMNINININKTNNKYQGIKF